MRGLTNALHGAIQALKSALDTVDSKVGNPSSASSVSGADAFSKINTLNSNLSAKVKALYCNTNWVSTHSIPVTAQAVIGLILVDDGTTYSFVQYPEGSVVITKLFGSNTISYQVSGGYNIFTLATARGLTVWGISNF